MKRFITISLAVAVAGTAAMAQTMTDALTFSQNNYYGTARSMALGNAMTALGGDLGSIGLNPAGSAVARYSQFAVTPGYSISSNTSAFSQSNFTILTNGGRYKYQADNFGPESTDRYSKMTLPDIGVSLSYDTGNSSGVRSISFALLSSNTSQYLNRFTASGINENTSMLGYFAAAADWSGLPFDVFDQDYNPYSYYNRDVVAAYDSYMINPFGDKGYIAVTQSGLTGDDASSFRNSGLLRQKAIVQNYGSKHDLVLNLAANVDDKLFVGLNLGLPMFSYSNTEFFGEDADDPEQFPISIVNSDGTVKNCYFQTADYTYDYWADAEGIYGKIGIIYLPTDNVRLGLSLQTPTLLTVDEGWTMAASTMISDVRHQASDVPEWNNRYNLRTPGIIDLGVAVTVLDRGFISADYEFADYSAMKYSTYEELALGEDDPFTQVNRLNSLFCGASHALRIGAEYKITSALSARAGYNFTTSPLKYYEDVDGSLIDADVFDANWQRYDTGLNPFDRKYSMKLPSMSWSCGLGWSSSGSFFADAAVRGSYQRAAYYQPYPVYQSFDGGNTYTASALVKNTRRMIDVALTLGWRF
ncbi:MAG: outer membrane protein transport protein [Bacteroidales bacterium]|nr:outer membrane protein transport protein [Bacteroidales bacterium]